MAEASIVAGVAFSHPRTTGSHACSFPLTNIYGLPHGEACAFTLDYFIKFNADNADTDGRITALAKDLGFDNPLCNGRGNFGDEGKNGYEIKAFSNRM